jgi:hypothetical protein
MAEKRSDLAVKERAGRAMTDAEFERAAEALAQVLLASYQKGGADDDGAAA